MTCTGESCRQGRTTCTERCADIATLDWVMGVLIALAKLASRAAYAAFVFFATAAAIGLSAGYTWGVIQLARNFKFL